MSRKPEHNGNVPAFLPVLVKPVPPRQKRPPADEYRLRQYREKVDSIIGEFQLIRGRAKLGEHWFKTIDKKNALLASVPQSFFDLAKDPCSFLMKTQTYLGDVAPFL